MKINIIVSMAKNRVIGKKDKLLWHIREDLIRLKNLTKDQVVILGRKTYDSMVSYYDKSGRPMPSKLYIVVTHDKKYRPARENAKTAESIEQALEIAKQTNQKEIFAIGGQSIFEQMINLADKIYLTIVDKKFEGSSYFPDYSGFKRVISESDWVQSLNLRYKFLELEK